MSELHALRNRRSSLESMLEMVQERIDALTPGLTLHDWQRGTAAERVLLFLWRHSLITWSPAELMEATLCGESAIRRVLTQLVAERRISREGHAGYRAVTP